jgi:hypothetical protein
MRWFQRKTVANAADGHALLARSTSLRICVLALGVLDAHYVAAAAAGGSLTGSVVDDSGRPVAGARVLISYAPSVKPPGVAPPVVTGPLAAVATTDSTGAFHTSSLAPGSYIACSEAPASGYLDPCHWSTSAPNFVISAGEAVPGITIVMPKGAVLSIQVNDPQQVLKPAAGPIDLALEVHVVTSKGIHYSAPIQSSSATGRSYAIAIPFATPVTLRVLSSHLAVSDQSGQPVATMGATFNVPAGSTPAVTVFTVTGTK